MLLIAIIAWLIYFSISAYISVYIVGIGRNKKLVYQYFFILNYMSITGTRVALELIYSNLSTCLQIPIFSQNMEPNISITKVTWE